MNVLTNPAVTGVARHLLQVGAGVLLAHGYIDASGVDVIVGFGLSALTLASYLIPRLVKK